MKEKRTFKPSTKYIGKTSIHRLVERWEWTLGEGLRVVYRDGSTYPSEYTLIELLREEKPLEIAG